MQIGLHIPISLIHRAISGLWGWKGRNSLKTFGEFNMIRERKFTDPSIHRILEGIDFLVPAP